MYYGENNHVEEINFLDSEKYVSFPYKVSAETTGVVNGVLPAGSVIPTNDAKAVAVTISDVDVSHGTQLVGGIVDGFINAKRLPVTPTAEAITALKRITFSNTETESEA